MYYLLLSACVLSRLIFTIYYIEDIDSLRFAYSIIDEFNISKLQPHFPGYALFCFVGNILYDLIGNMAMTFSLIGGLSIFFIIYFTLQLLDFKLDSKEGIFTTLFIFFNPMFWLMSNRYMPDLMGLSILIAAFYFLNKKDYGFIGAFFCGLILGVRLSYFPFLLFPIIFVFIKHKNKLLFLTMATMGFIVWAVPMIYIEGFNNLFNAAIKHTAGHFTEYGGSIITESNWNTRFFYLINTIWADGLGGYWKGRTWITIILSLLILPLILLSIINYNEILKSNKMIYYLILACFLYLLWIFFFQNIIHKSRHVMPIVLTLIIVFSKIMKKYIFNRGFWGHIYIVGLILLTGYMTINLALQHKNPTAISQIGKFLYSKNQPMVIISPPLINYYLKSQNLNAEYIDIDINSNSFDASIFEDNKQIIVIGNITTKINNLNITSDTLFYHNPYVNKMWSTIPIYSNTKI